MQKKPLTRKQALAVLDRLRSEYYFAMPYQEYVQKKTMWEEVHDAMFILTQAIHGPHAPRQYTSLCSECHLRYAEQCITQTKTALIEYSYSLYCCNQCAARLQNEGKMAENETAPESQGNEGQA